MGQGRCKERKGREGRVDGPYCRAEKSQMGKQGPVAKGTMTLTCSPWKSLALEHQDWQSQIGSWTHDDWLSEIQRHCPPTTVSMGTSVSHGVLPRHWESLSETPGWDAEEEGWREWWQREFSGERKAGSCLGGTNISDRFPGQILREWGKGNTEIRSKVGCWSWSRT